MQIFVSSRKRSLMANRIDRILEEHPEFAKWFVESLPSKSVDMFLQLYLSGITPQQMKIMQMMNLPQEEDDD